MTVLILGGTGEARALAAALEDAGVPLLSSLAGRVRRPRLPVGPVRVGGFGGAAGLAAFLSEQAIDAVVDATHPFAERISASAVQACGAAGVPLLRLERPGWTAGEGDLWTWVDDLEGAARAVTASGAKRVFLTSGRQGLAAFAELADPWFLIRCVDPPDVALPARHELLLDRGPYTEHGEGEILDRQRIDLLVTKDSGGALTAAKLAAARDRGIPVVVVRRPPRPDVATVTTVAESVAWVRSAYETPDRRSASVPSRTVPQDVLAVPTAVQDLLFREARSANTFTDAAVDDAQLEAIFDLVRWGPTSGNTQPLRLLAVRSADGKRRLLEHVSPGNRAKVQSAPLTLVVAYDREFHRHFGRLFPHDPQSGAVYDTDVAFRLERARLNAALQAGYLIVGIRAAGLAAGPLAGFDHAGLDADLLADTTWRSFLLLNVGHPGPDAWRDRLPRLAYDEVVATV